MSSEQLQLPPIELSSYEQLILVAVAVLVQALDLVENSLNEDAQLCFASTLIPGSTIGKHLRHARDHFTLLLDGLTRDKPLRVSYDTRVRDTPMETSRTAASEALKETIERLRSLKVNDIDEELILDAITPYPQTLKTTIGRELWFGSLHAIHHWSMVRVVAGEMGITIEPSFGVAPSTLLYRELGTSKKSNL
ncbi:hypothetical protein FRC14_002979 [Serendipita sp. 396]|nr:hypothetical protein FRC14_002979 [Serendipita sp. 396]KAG8784746.1 hypothetical protein FRC15_002669 [Serendipita sp. 397]KAG8799889.1 hypothetical protein FRC16_004199 [Serendipita sp. 398]KAG8822355.1 hypothetical protein FRC19_006136 [Serendipita sp. 401]KAG8871063.1 hypothetical protein FRC20_010984 [Serendipita sp. 405]KAG9053230.1 hypothetical protein FS842_008478 [Serendipita sp. 407]